MKFFKSKFFIISVIVALVLILVPSMLSVFGYSGLVRNAIKTAATPFEWCGRQIADAVNGFVSVFTEYDELLAENKELKDKLAELENDQYENSVLRDQNDWLKKYLNLKEQSPEFSITNATVISREAGNYATVLTINKGTVHGIKRHMPVITEDGGSLSQGEKQLLCITRVMLCLPPMLILDEATSSIDTRTEQHIQRAFETLMTGRTSFIVAHRLSTIQNANTILVMKDGNVIEQGNHEELLAKGGFYANLYNSQFAH